MAFFKFRKGGDDQTAAPPPPAPESVEAMRKRARHRLIGASVLVLLGVIGFPLLFDSQPRPIAVDIPIEIPDKGKVKPLGNAPVVAPGAQVRGTVDAGPAAAPAASAAAGARPAVAVAPLTPVSAAVATPAPAPVAKSDSKPESKPEGKTDSKPADKAAAKAGASAQEGAKAQALLDGKTVEPKPAAAAAGRFVVQVGAFADVAKAREARLKLEKAGLKTYTQVVQAKDGRRVRVRVGPFESKAAADKAAQKIKKLDLPAAILEL